MILIYLFIYLLQLRFHLLAVVGTLLQKVVYRQLYTEEENYTKLYKKHKIYKIENKYTKQANKRTKNIKNISRVTWK